MTQTSPCRNCGLREVVGRARCRECGALYPSERTEWWLAPVLRTPQQTKRVRNDPRLMAARRRAARERQVERLADERRAQQGLT
jgi:hypothetical protein